MVGDLSTALYHLHSKNSIFLYLFFFILGSCIGSFLNVVADRTLRKEQFVKGKSRCEFCNKELKFYDLIPIISYLSTGGKCRYCKKELSKKYLIAEIVTAFVTVLLVYKNGNNIGELVTSLILMYTLIVASLTDIKVREVPDRFHIVGFGLILLFKLILPNDNFATKTDELVWSIKGALICFAVLYGIYILSGGRLGGADVKIYTPIGLGVGTIRGIESFLYSAPISLIILGIIYLITKKSPKGIEIPYIPFIAIGVLVTYFYDYMYVNFGIM